MYVYRNTLSDALTADRHQRRFKLLLQLEEIQMEVDIRKYDLFGIHLGQYNANRRLLTLEVLAPVLFPFLWIFTEKLLCCVKVVKRSYVISGLQRKC